MEEIVQAIHIGVEWVTDLKFFFPLMMLTMVDFLPRLRERLLFTDSDDEGLGDDDDAFVSTM